MSGARSEDAANTSSPRSSQVLLQILKACWLGLGVCGPQRVSRQLCGVGRPPPSPPSACTSPSDSIAGSAEPSRLLRYFRGCQSQGHRTPTSHGLRFLPTTALLVAPAPSFLLSSHHGPWSRPQRHCLPFIPQCAPSTRSLRAVGLQRPRFSEGSQSHP